MSNEKQETIADIVAKMRRDCPERHMDGTMYRDGDWVYTKGTVKRLADRIEAAEKRYCSDCAWYHIYNNGLDELLMENARLRAALKPVLECKVRSAMTAEIEPGRSDYCANIIEKAQRVYNESNESEEMK